jgi:uncharacterized protein DUF4446
MIVGTAAGRNPGQNARCILPANPMVLSDETLSLLVLVSLGVSVLALFGAIAVSTRRRSPQSSLSDGPVAVAVREQGDAIARLSAAVQQLSAEDRKLVGLVRGSVQHVGLVRYDAFEDMGGHLSFSTALLNADGDGVVITSINGRADTRCYAKTVKAGQSEHNLSEEEEEAIRQALAGTPVTTP